MGLWDTLTNNGIVDTLTGGDDGKGGKVTGRKSMDGGGGNKPKPQNNKPKPQKPGPVSQIQDALGISRPEARTLRDQFKNEQAMSPELTAFIDKYQANNVDPLATQLFYGQTVAPFLQQQSQIQQQTAAAGQDYMANLMKTTQMDPAYKQFLSASTPALLNQQNQAGVAGQAAAVAAPAIDALFNRLQNDIDAKNKLAYEQQIASSGGGAAAANPYAAAFAQAANQS